MFPTRYVPLYDFTIIWFWVANIVCSCLCQSQWQSVFTVCLFFQLLFLCFSFQIGVWNQRKAFFHFCFCGWKSAWRWCVWVCLWGCVYGSSILCTDLNILENFYFHFFSLWLLHFPSFQFTLCSPVMLDGAAACWEA